jgi:very-short-patch-repair endonuclease
MPKEFRPRSIERMRNLRRKQTDAERLAWRLLRNRHLAGLKFRRQHPIGRYAIDFYCVDLKLAIELDGTAHTRPGQTRKDKIKDAYLNRLGVHVLRLPNGIVLQDSEAFLCRIVEFARSNCRRIDNAPSPPAPLPEGEGRGKRGSVHENKRPSCLRPLPRGEGGA